LFNQQIFQTYWRVTVDTRLILGEFQVSKFLSNKIQDGDSRHVDIHIYNDHN